MSEIVPAPFPRPADYYAAPLSDVRPLFPRWVPFGCGTASLIMIVVLFVAGALAASGKGGAIFGTLFGTMQDEIHGMFTKDVSPAQKAAFDAEMKTLRGNLTAGKVSMDRLQPLLQAIRETSGDSTVTPAETEQLTKAAHAANTGK